MYIEKKIYLKDDPVTTGKGNFEKILLLVDEKEVLYIPEFSKEYSFPKDTLVHEILLGNSKRELNKPENMASPFFLSGDACFYNFMARKIMISDEQSFFNKRGKDLLWKISGDLYYSFSGKDKRKLDSNPVFLEGQNTVYNITGHGEVFLLKL